MDSYSEARSVYKLDPNISEPQQANSVSGRKNVTPGRNSGSGMKATNFKTQASPQQNIEQLFQRLGVRDQTQILDKIHDMRLKAFQKREYENMVKPHMPSFCGQEKEKINEQYNLAKR